MNLTPLQMMILGAAALVGYLTWSTMQGGSQLVDEAIPRVGRAAHRPHESVPPAPHKGRDPFLKSSELGKYDSGPEIVGGEEGSGIMRLTGVVTAGAHRIAYVDGRRFRVGDSYRGLNIDKIEVNRVSLSGGGDRLDLWLDPIAGGPGTSGGGARNLVAKEKDRIEIIHANRSAPTDLTETAKTGEAKAGSAEGVSSE